MAIVVGLLEPTSRKQFLQSSAARFAAAAGGTKATPNVLLALGDCFDQTKFTNLSNILAKSLEYDTNLIQADYQQYLGRAASAAELPYWFTAIQNGETDEQIEAGFLGAPECRQEQASQGGDEGDDH